jgi:uracil-DNA glycosylase
MINEVPPPDPRDNFYSTSLNPNDLQSALALFAKSGVEAATLRDLLNLGIYLTTAVKIPKTSYAVDPAVIQSHLPLLQAELDLFPNLRAIMLMGDVAKKSLNLLAKSRGEKNIIPSGSTCRIRHNEFHWGALRVFPSYIMTGKNLLIEKCKCDTISDDIRRMTPLLRA